VEKTRNEKIRLIALDLDGTLFDAQGQISELDRRGIREAVRQGTEVVISTGRPLLEIPCGLLSSLGVRYAITVNGAAVYRIPDWECLYEKCLEPETASDLLYRLHELDAYSDVFCDGKAFGFADRREMIPKLSLPEKILDFIANQSLFEEDLPSYLNKKGLEVQKITMNFLHGEDGHARDHDRACGILESFPELTVVSGGGDNLEITAGETTKGRSLLRLCDLLEIAPEETMAVGDSDNDRDILETAAVGVAMENSPENLKQAADWVTKSNSESGVYWAIKRALNG